MTTHNDITIVGNVTRDPELRFLTSGTPLCNLGVACNRRFKKGDDWEEETSFFDIVVWRDQAENVAESIAKGDRIIVTGNVQMRQWETDDGQKRSKLEVVADEIGLSLKWATGTTTRTPSRAASESTSSAPPASAYAEAEEPF